MGRELVVLVLVTVRSVSVRAGDIFTYILYFCLKPRVPGLLSQVALSLYCWESSFLHPVELKSLPLQRPSAHFPVETV